MTRAAVFGSGSWGTAFGCVLAAAGTPTTLWARREELARSIRERRENADYLPGCPLPDGLTATHVPAEALAGADFVVLAVPSQTLRANLADWAAVIPPDALLVSLMKGIERGTSKRMSEVIIEVAGAAADRVAVVTGPNLAHEVAHRQPAATVVASSSAAAAERLQQACGAPWFRPYTNADVVGCELGGTVKNVIALACGIAEGLGYGDNTRASLITRGLAETARLGVCLGAEPMTFAGLAGLGDLVATCTSPLSRNRTFGEKLGRGLTMADITAGTHQVAEGVRSGRSVLDLAERHSVDMPITSAVTRVVEGDLTVGEMVRELLARDVTSE